MIIYIGLFILLIPSGIHDLRTRLIPVWYVGIFAGLAVLYHLLLSDGFFLQMTAGAALGLLFMLVSRISGGALGMGDALVITALGLWCGISDCLTLVLFAFVLSGTCSGIWILVRRKSRKDSLPFVPFLLLSCIVSCTAALIQGQIV